MKFNISFKTPDAMDQGIRSALLEDEISDGVDEDGNMDRRTEPTRSMLDVAEKFIQFGEFVVIQFDTNNGTATVLPLGRQKSHGA